MVLPMSEPHNEGARDCVQPYQEWVMVGVGAYCTKSSSSWTSTVAVHLVATLKARGLSRSGSCASTCMHMMSS